MSNLLFIRIVIIIFVLKINIFQYYVSYVKKKESMKKKFNLKQDKFIQYDRNIS